MYRYVRLFLIIVIPLSVDSCTNDKPSSSYPSVSAAAQAASNMYNPISIAEDREYMGAILRENGRYRFTVTRGVVGGATVTIKIPKQDMSKVVAFWHTHGRAVFQYQFFSVIDTTLVNQFKLPLYLADYTGALKVFRPGDQTMSKRRALRLRLSEEAGYAFGEEVLSESGQPIRVKTRC